MNDVRVETGAKVWVVGIAFAVLFAAAWALGGCARAFGDRTAEDGRLRVTQVVPAPGAVDPELDEPMHLLGLHRAGGAGAGAMATRVNTFPSRLPLFAMDRIYMRGLRCSGITVPRGAAWARMSDHLPLMAELALE